MNQVNLIRVYIDNYHIGIDVGFLPIVLVIVLFVVFVVMFFLIKSRISLFDFLSPEVQLSVPLGGLGSISIKADYSISQIAYTAWAELITRKAGLPIDQDNDVIVEIYNSWYQLFGKMRDLIKTVPAMNLKKKNTRILINLLVDTLNKGLRPHLTVWQSKFNKWYRIESEKEENKSKSPQEIQRQYPEYDSLMKDMLLINQQMVNYTKELKKLIKFEVEH